MAKENDIPIIDTVRVVDIGEASLYANLDDLIVNYESYLDIARHMPEENTLLEKTLQLIINDLNKLNEREVPA